VSAKEQSSGVEASVTVKPSYGLTDEQIAGMLRESFSTAQQDMQARALVEARVDAERMVLATRSAIAADGALLDATEREAIETLVAELERARAGSDAAAIEAATKALAEGTEPFAARRMNQGIARALAGRKIESV